MNPIQENEDRPAWLVKHGAWVKAMQRRVNMVNRSSDWHRDGFVNLTTIRHRFEPAEQLSAMEEARRQDDAEWIQAWKAGILMALAITAVTLVGVEVVLWMMRRLL